LHATAGGELVEGGAFTLEMIRGDKLIATFAAEGEFIDAGGLVDFTPLRLELTPDIVSGEGAIVCTAPADLEPGEYAVELLAKDFDGNELDRETRSVIVETAMIPTITFDELTWDAEAREITGSVTATLNLQEAETVAWSFHVYEVNAMVTENEKILRPEFVWQETEMVERQTTPDEEQITVPFRFTVEDGFEIPEDMQAKVLVKFEIPDQDYAVEQLSGVLNFTE
jgi:hypothetical protein